MVWHSNGRCYNNKEDTIYNDINAIKLRFETKTNKLTSTLFKVNNSYETIINKKSFEILSFKKSTYQPNVTNQLYTINSENGLIYNDSINFIIPKNCFNIFSLLYYLFIIYIWNNILFFYNI